MQVARRIWIAAVCALGVLVSASAVQAQATKLLPADTELVVTINIQQMLKSEVVKANKALIELAKGKIAEQLEEKGVDKWLKKANFDIFKDLSSITVAIPGGDRTPDDGFIVMEGKFDADKIEAAAIEASKEAGGGFKKTMIAGVKAYEVDPKGDKTMYVGILNKTTLIACASKKDFENAVERMNGTKTGGLKNAMVKDLLKTVNNKQSISMIATSGVLTKISEKNPQAGNPQAKAVIDGIGKIDAFSASITIQKDVDFQVGINAKDEKTAKEFANITNVGLGIAKAKLKEQVENNAQLAPALDVVNTIRATTQGANLLIRGQVTFETLEKLLQNLPTPN